MNCELCLCPLRRTKSYSIYEEFFDDKNRLVDVIEKYLQMEVKVTGYQSALLCQSCYTHLDDFHKFALLIKERQESLTNVNIPIIKLESSDEEGDIEDNGYIRDTDVVVEFQTGGHNTTPHRKNRNESTIQFGDDELLIPYSAGFQNNSGYYNSTVEQQQTSWHSGDDFRSSKTSSKSVAPVRKTPYKTHNPEDRSRIVEAANRGDDWSALASKLGVKYKTAYTWVSISRKEMFLKSGKISFSDDEVKTIIKWIEDNRSLTLKEIVKKIKTHFQKDVCVYFVECLLEGRLYHHRRTNDYNPHLINTVENKTRRSEYVKTLEYYSEQNKTIVWLGETTFKIFCRRAKGRFNTNTGFFATCDLTLHMMGALTQAGVIAIKRSRDRLRPEEIFKSWIETSKCDVTNLVIVCDSDYCFSELDEYFNNSDVTLLLLSPYSYMLNPLESIWNYIKLNVKSQPQSHMSLFNPSDIREQRLIFAEKCIDDLLPLITKDDCMKAVDNVKKCHNDVLDMQDMSI